ncbi:hypothetical protein WISP_115855 [Willisornis vidua]|uniref:Uncharacterized protein n=1 Tax=Willisornis vidua TaxID=1566151 RepID=A0ABQ9CV03_9PASS|nr:hypothetical protein WISP_115855 [Willisornis vidua]
MAGASLMFALDVLELQCELKSRRLGPVDESTWKQISTCSPWRAWASAGGCPKEAVTLWEAHTGSRQDLWSHEQESPHWNRFAGRICDPMGTLLEGLYTVEGTHAGPVHEELQPLGRTQNPMMEQGRRCSRHWNRDSPATPSEDQRKQNFLLCFVCACHFCFDY